MTEYEFVHVDDERIVRTERYPMGAAPKIGEIVRLDGTRWRRVPSGHISAGVATVTHGYPRISHALPRHLPGAGTTAEGKPIITSRRHEKELIQRHGLQEF